MRGRPSTRGEGSSPVPDPGPEEIHRARTIRTLAKRKDEWLAHARENAPHADRDISLLWVEQDFGEGISVAAGPSLADDLFELRRMRLGRELAVVDAGLKFLLAEGIEPDYVVSTDSSERVAEMLDVGRCGAKLILNVIAHPRVRQVWKGDIFWWVMASNVLDLDEGAMMQDLHSATTRIGGKLVPGGNVSSAAFGFMASVRNVSKLHLFGHDFCWKDRMYPDRGMDDLEAARLKDEGEAGTIYETVNTRGEKVTTNLSLQRYQAWHEEAIAAIRSRVVNHTKSTTLKT